MNSGCISSLFEFIVVKLKPEVIQELLVTFTLILLIFLGTKGQTLASIKYQIKVLCQCKVKLEPLGRAFSVPIYL